MYPNTRVTWDTSVKKRIESNLVELQEWQDKYPKVFESDVTYGGGEYLQKLKVEASDIEWHIPCKDIPLANYGVVYSNGDVGNMEKIQHVETLVKQGVIREMQPHEKGFLNPILFIKQVKEGKSKVRKVMDFKKLNSY